MKIALGLAPFTRRKLMFFETAIYDVNSSQNEENLETGHFEIKSNIFRRSPSSRASAAAIRTTVCPSRTSERI